MAAPSTSPPRKLRIGVDVGGTNTDGAILDPARAGEPDKGIVASHKAPTTTNPSAGINAAITAMFGAAHVAPDEVASVTIGTTHFVNAVVERDAARLARVAVLRLCGPFAKYATPCIDWPADMKALILGYAARVRGGLEVDGHLIDDIDPAELRAECARIRDLGIHSVVLVGVFSPIDTVECQEERAAAIVRAELPDADVVLSKDVANLGFLERENAAILNASILAFARKTIRSFQEPIKALGLKCPVFVTQNDGTILSGDMAAKLPIRTFSSGPTNSMRGAAFLVGNNLEEDIMVVDIGGTTTDVGLLQANGFPRQQAAFSDFAGVRLNFSCPDIKSIGLGGGSIVRKGEHMTVGPDSVGYKLTEEALVFGGKTLTATDCTVLADPSVNIGNPELVKGALDEEEVAKYQAIVKHKIEKIIDTMKTSPEDLPVLLVGGGAVIAPNVLTGASKVLKPEFAAVANAIGAAIARVSAVVDTVKSTESKSNQELQDEISEDAIERTVAAGALRDSVKVVEVENIPLPVSQNCYIAELIMTTPALRSSELIINPPLFFSTSRIKPVSSYEQRETVTIHAVPLQQFLTNLRQTRRSKRTSMKTRPTSPNSSSSHRPSPPPRRRKRRWTLTRTGRRSGTACGSSTRRTWHGSRRDATSWARVVAARRTPL
jgi:N-methylhydantoinase A/oxoprolinase/acetone carboxylase beta subunit